MIYNGDITICFLTKPTQDSPGHGGGIHGWPGKTVVRVFCQEWTKLFSQGDNGHNGQIILILYLDYSCLKETPVDFQLFWFLNLFAVAKQAESTGWSGKGHPSKVMIIKFESWSFQLKLFFSRFKSGVWASKQQKSGGDSLVLESDRI